MAPFSDLTDDELSDKLREHGISSPVLPATRKVLLKKLAALESKISKKSKINSSPIRVSPRCRNRISNKSGLNAYSSDEEENEDLKEETSKVNLYNIFNKGNTSFSENSVNSSKFKSAENKLPLLRKRSQYSEKFGSIYKRKSFDNFNYDTGSDTDVCDDADSTLSEKNISSHRSTPNDYVYNNQKLKAISNHRLPSTLANHANKRKYDFVENDCIDTTVQAQEKHVSQNGDGPLFHMMKFSSEDCDKDFWWSSVPLILVGLVVVFFCFIGICYMSIHYDIHPAALLSYLSYFRNAQLRLSDDQNQESKIKTSVLEGNRFPVCQTKDELNCVTEGEMQSVLKVLGMLESHILPALVQQANLYQCGKAPHLHILRNVVSDIISQELPQESMENIRLSVNALEKLVNLNPEWGVKAVYFESEESSTGELIGFEAINYSNEILCRLTSALYSIFSVLIIVASCALAFWFAIRCYKFYRKQSGEMEQQSFELVEQILDLLENSCGTGGKDFIAVNHVRDSLISPRERMTKAAIWAKAIKFIDDHDSRVYRELRSVNGEDCEVWRWVCGAPRSPISCTTSALQPETTQPPEKVWQGQAFENLETSQNIPLISPTSCLKVRNMFDGEIEYGDEWPRRIQDSLLEKCLGASIVHVAVDRASKEGCVYLKCASTGDAGKAFRALHGWWFDGNLVTVKYLREERYHERFPTSRLAFTPLTPSNDKKFSLLNSKVASDNDINVVVRTRRSTGRRSVNRR